VPQSSPLILLVEDDPEDEAATIQALGGSGVAHAVQVVRDGPAALEWLWREVDAGRRLPVVVLLDLKLPRMDGLEVLRRLRADPRTRPVPVVVLTTSEASSDLERSYDLGANSFIRKPVDFPRFAKAIADLGFYWTVVVETPPGGSSATA
jgi:CheY-like chemotaxis protein